MDRFVSMFGAMAWPLATLVIVLLFKRDVTQALSRVGRFRYRDLEVTFRDDLKQAEELARTIPPPPTKAAIMLEIDPGELVPLTGQLIGTVPSKSLEVTKEDRESLIKLSVRSPREAVDQAWAIVVKALGKTAMTMGERRTATTENPELATLYLLERGYLSRPEALLVGLLRNLRDRAAQDSQSPSADDAQRFVELAFRIADRIEERP